MNTSIQALTLDIEQDGWSNSRGFVKRNIPMPTLQEQETVGDATSVIVKVLYAGLCGSDRGIWCRCAFTDMFHTALKKEQKTMRILGHEFVGEVVDVGSQVTSLYGIKKGDTVSGDSHITCGKCFQCKMGEQEVCQDQTILGISIDGIFAEYVKIPAKNMWAVDFTRVRPEVCAVYDPFGNAVHALTKVDMRGSRVAIFGCGQIGLFSILLARQFGAAKVIAVDVNKHNLEIAKKLGAHETICIEPQEKKQQYERDADVIKKIYEITYGKGVDVALEMAGYNSSVNNCIDATRFGGQVILFGIKDGDLVIPEWSRIVVKGITIHNVIGRQLFKTWQIAQRVLSDVSNGVQDHVWSTILHHGRETIIPFSEYSVDLLEERMKKYPKILFDMTR